MSESSDKPVCHGRGVFCNSTLNLRGISAIGYDMDYTLIHYRVAEWECCAFDHAKRCLEEAGWPVADLTFAPDQMIQGLVVDTERGNLCKVNRFGYVKRALHGTKPLDFEEQRRVYARTIVDHRDARFVFMATLFSLSESSLYAQLVDLWDAGALPGVNGYVDLYRRARGSIDEAHREGQLKAEITADPDRFVALDPDTPRTLLDQRDAGKQLLLVTNSEWSYTSRMMTYTFDRYLPEGQTWRDLFDFIIVSARKPDFFSGHSPLLEVVDEEGLLRPTVELPQPGHVYFGGSAGLFERTLDLSGDRILYVGDHFFGDVHATKKILRWRTALIARELEEEIEAAAGFAATQRELEALMREKEALEHRTLQRRLRLQRHRRKRERLSGKERATIEGELGGAREELDALDARIAPLAKMAAELGNHNWGPLMRTGNDKSYLAHLLERHADIYTSRVSNLMFETPFRFFRSARGTLPHDLLG
jgi:HAD superfamily 5'-nucleotidase-like hydrolase